MYHICKLVFFFFFKFHQKVQHSIVQKFEFSAKKPKTKSSIRDFSQSHLFSEMLRLRWWKAWLKWKKSRHFFFFSPSFHSSRGLMNFVLILPLLFQHMTAVAISKGMLRSHKSDPQQQCRQSLLKFHPLSWKEKRLALKPSFRNSFSWLNIIAKVIQYKRQFNPLLAITSSSVVVVARARNHSLSSVHISRHVCEPVFV